MTTALAPGLALTAVSAAGESQPSVIVPEISDIFWSAIAFTIIYLMFRKFVLPQVQTMLDQRAEGIEKKLADAEQARAEAEKMLALYKAKLATAREEGAAIIAKAENERIERVEAAKREAIAANTALKAQAQDLIVAEYATAKGQLSREVGILAAQLAERIVGEAIDEGVQQRTIDRFVAEIESMSAGRD